MWQPLKGLGFPTNHESQSSLPLTGYQNEIVIFTRPKSQLVTDGLLSHWTFDTPGVAGPTVRDVRGDRDGTIIGDAKVVKGRIGDALQFDGSGDYVAFDDAGLPDGNAPRTMALWLKPKGEGVRVALDWGTHATARRSGILLLQAGRPSLLVKRLISNRMAHWQMVNGVTSL